MENKIIETIFEILNKYTEKAVYAVKVCNFGTYRQYELAGDFINSETLDEDDPEVIFEEKEFSDYECSGKYITDISDKDYDKLHDLLEPLTNSYQNEKISGQNTLWLNNKGEELISSFSI